MARRGFPRPGMADCRNAATSQRRNVATQGIVATDAAGIDPATPWRADVESQPMDDGHKVGSGPAPAPWPRVPPGERITVFR